MSVEQSLRALLSEGERDGTLRPGAKLPTERALVDQLAAPRSAVRRALEVLEHEGVVERHVGRGTFLTGARQLARTPDDTSPAEIMQVRLLVEPPIAALAARVATVADLDRVTRCLEHGGAADDFASFETWDAKLHRCIAEAAHNGLLMNMFDVMNTARELPVWGSLKRRTSTPERRRCYQTEHAAIVEALRDRDPDAAREAMRDHLDNVANNLLGQH